MREREIIARRAEPPARGMQDMDALMACLDRFPLANKGSAPPARSQAGGLRYRAGQ